MKSLFGGLEKFGLDEVIDKVDIYKKTEETKEKTSSVIQKKEEKDFLINKVLECPVCGEKFNNLTTKHRGIRQIGKDLDLRPLYAELDVIKYGVTACPYCGYAALNSYFPKISTFQGKIIIEKIAPYFKNTPEWKNTDTYSYDYALERYKLALLSTSVKKATYLETAMCCMRMSWVCRGKRQNDSCTPEDIKQLKMDEAVLIEKSYYGLKMAYEKEYLEGKEIDSMTCLYLLGVLAKELGKYDEALRYVSEIIVAPRVNQRIKNLARDLKDIIKSEKK